MLQARSLLRILIRFPYMSELELLNSTRAATRSWITLRGWSHKGPLLGQRPFTWPYHVSILSEAARRKPQSEQDDAMPGSFR
jgi:hypothetical protein